MVLMQAKWYYYVILGIVDVEANFLGKCFVMIKVKYNCQMENQVNFLYIRCSGNSSSGQSQNLVESNSHHNTLQSKLF